MKLLVIEDEHKIANSIKQGLIQEKYTVDVAYDGKVGLDLAIGEKYEVIILDRMLPGTSGDDILKTLRTKNIHTPVLMLTAKGQIKDKVDMLNTGADDYLTKPFAFTELVARIKALTRRPQKTFSSELKIRDLTLNTQTYAVKREETEISLSNKEFMLLEFLMRHPNKIYNKEQIIEQVWSYESDVMPNSVEVYIKHLRDKIDKPFEDKPNLIHTVRGFGYKID